MWGPHRAYVYVVQVRGPFTEISDAAVGLIYCLRAPVWPHLSLHKAPRLSVSSTRIAYDIILQDCVAPLILIPYQYAWAPALVLARNPVTSPDLAGQVSPASSKLLDIQDDF